MARGGAFKHAATLTLALTNGVAVSGKLPAGGESLLVYNPTNGTAFAKIGQDNTVVATAADIPIPATKSRLIDLGPMQSGAIAPGAAAPPKFLSLLLIAGATNGNAYASVGDGSSY